VAAYSGNKTLSLVSALLETSGLYYKPMTIINNDSRVVNKLETSLTDDARVVIYGCHMFIVQATRVNVMPKFFNLVEYIR
jgi:hypothetical protein